MSRFHKLSYRANGLGSGAFLKALEAESRQADQRISMADESDNPYGKEKNKMADLKTTLEKTFALTPQIESLLRVSTFDNYGDLCSLQINEEDSNELFLINELQRIMCSLEEAKNRIAYLKRPVKETSHLHKNAGGRYETSSGHVYTSGDVIEVLLGDSFDETPYWVRTSVEHNGRDYYLVNYKDISMEGLAVRRR